MDTHLEIPGRAPTRRRRRVVISTLVAMLVVLLVAATPTVMRLVRDPAAGEPVVGVDHVAVRNDAFDPPVIQIESGTTVTWTFDDGNRAHNVVGDGWLSEVLAAGEYQHTFTEPGSYPYTCTLHWGMNGRVEVTK